jgi:hypothetical protein
MSKGIYDAESTVVLRAADSAAVTSTETGTAQVFTWDATPGFAVVLNVSAVKTSATDEAYNLSIESLDEAGSNAVVQLAAPTIAEAGEYRFLIDGQTAAKLDADAAQIRAVMTLAGTSPSITYSCVINPAFGVGGRP